MYVARDELQDCAALLVHPERLGRRVEANAVKVCEERVHRGCPRPGSSADGVAHLDGGAQVATEDLFLHPPIVSAFSAAARLTDLLRRIRGRRPARRPRQDCPVPYSSQPVPSGLTHADMDIYLVHGTSRHDL